MEQLTAREREVLALIAHGLSNDDIARHLILGTTTIKTHVGRIFMKLGLHDRAQAVAAAYQSGLVHPGDVPSPPGADSSVPATAIDTSVAHPRINSMLRVVCPVEGSRISCHCASVDSLGEAPLELVACC